MKRGIAWLLLCLLMVGLAAPACAEATEGNKALEAYLLSQSIQRLQETKGRLEAYLEMNSIVLTANTKKDGTAAEAEAKRLLEVDVEQPVHMIYLTFDQLLLWPNTFSDNPANLSENAKRIFSETMFYGSLSPHNFYTDISRAYLDMHLHTCYAHKTLSSTGAPLTKRYTIAYLFFLNENGTYDMASVGFEKHDEGFVQTSVGFWGNPGENGKGYVASNGNLLKLLFFRGGGMPVFSDQEVFSVKEPQLQALLAK